MVIQNVDEIICFGVYEHQIDSVRTVRLSNQRSTSSKIGVYDQSYGVYEKIYPSKKEIQMTSCNSLRVFLEGKQNPMPCRDDRFTEQ